MRSRDGRSSEPENELEGIVERSLLLGREVCDAVVEAADVDRPELLDKHARDLASDDDLRPERRSGGAPRGRRNDGGGQPEQRVRLDDDCIPRTALLVSTAGR